MPPLHSSIPVHIASRAMLKMQTNSNSPHFPSSDYESAYLLGTNGATFRGAKTILILKSTAELRWKGVPSVHIPQKPESLPTDSQILPSLNRESIKHGGRRTFD
ncbi:hypothetical protein FB45DRAFT_868577 [Roridomyces roridus]|uniref:Uncharacterized protein n=1 Tax=Roridomyces roridus TaxID=1738132 RepID=A0AAD7BQB5_9AGAR|nr:hypothetical protein FB45DRAFT_868577 [Roridomyces roridus]